MNISILGLRGCTALAMIGPLEIFRKINELISQFKPDTDQSPFVVNIVSVEGQEVKAAGDYPIYCHQTIADVEKTDLIIVPALDGDIEQQIEQNRSFIPWIRKMYEQGADIASLCTGAFLVAETDLLAGKVATTHWIAVDLFQRKYPNIQLLHEQIIVDAGRIYSCGGAMSFVNLIMYLVEKFCGSEIALLAAKMFLIDLNKSPQHSYAIFSTQKHHHDDEILRAQRWIETHYNKKLTVEKVAGHVAMSKRHFIRRFKHATGNTPLEYLQRVRVESVKKQLEAGKGSIETIVRSVGYDDMASFRKIFIRHTGLSPTEYRRRYERRNMIAVA